MIKIEHTAKSLAASYRAGNAVRATGGPGQAVVDPLVVALLVVMHHVLRDRVLQLSFAQKYHPTQTFFLYGAPHPERHPGPGTSIGP
jgi:hypothetical protein